MTDRRSHPVRAFIRPARFQALFTQTTSVHDDGWLSGCFQGSCGNFNPMVVYGVEGKIYFSKLMVRIFRPLESLGTISVET